MTLHFGKLGTFQLPTALTLPPTLCMGVALGPQSGPEC